MRRREDAGAGECGGVALMAWWIRDGDGTPVAGLLRAWRRGAVQQWLGSPSSPFYFLFFVVLAFDDG